MDNGEIFFIADANKDLESKVLWAAQSFKRKYGQEPTLCLLHPSLLKGQQKMGSLKLEPKKSILPSYLWIGTEADAPKPIAR
jgi:hypothetical protein